MKLKLAALFILLISLFNNTYSQTFKHSVGGTIIVLGAHVKIPYAGTLFIMNIVLSWKNWLQLIFQG